MKKKTVFRIFLVLTAAALVFASVLWFKLFGSATAFTGENIILKVRTGSTMADLRDQLVRENVVSDISAFDWACRIKRFGNNIKPGRYRIARGTSYNSLINQLRSGNQQPIMLEIPHCRTIPHLCGVLGRNLEADSVQFASFLMDPQVADSCQLTLQTLPSLFLSDTYECWWNTAPGEFLGRMKREHGKYWTAENLEKAKALGLDPVEVTTLASIVQGETARKDEAPRIAGLYLNRLRNGMRLQADPTVAFALNLDVPRLTFSDYQFPSPYNTYLIDGLPPGPIALVSRNFLDAVLNAESHNYVYMCAKPDRSGYHNFTSSYEQHLQNADAYRKSL